MWKTTIRSVLSYYDRIQNSALNKFKKSTKELLSGKPILSLQTTAKYSSIELELNVPIRLGHFTSVHVSYSVGASSTSSSMSSSLSSTLSNDTRNDCYPEAPLTLRPTSEEKIFHTTNSISHIHNLDQKTCVTLLT